MNVEALRYACERSAEQFEFYREQHLAKGTEDSLAKAEVNRQMAEMCREALKPAARIMEPISEEVRPEPDCHYEDKSPDRPEKACQNYSVGNNLELGRRIMNMIAPHWSQAVRNAAADEIRYFLGQQLTRFWDDITQFHHKFHLTYDGAPRSLPLDLAAFRINFMQEELNEYAKEYGATPVWQHTEGGMEPRWEVLAENVPADSLESRANQLDALVDLAYVLLGTAYLQGFNFAEAWRRVHRANVSKVRTQRASDSKRGSTFDVVKPEGWTAPNHLDLVGTIVIQSSPEPTVQHDLF